MASCPTGDSNQVSSPPLPVSSQGVKGPSSSCPTVSLPILMPAPPKVGRAPARTSPTDRPADHPQRFQHDRQATPRTFRRAALSLLGAYTIPKGSARFLGLG